MSRSIWKGPFRPSIPSSLSSPVNLTERACTITPEFINLQFKIHNGLSFSKPITISTSHIGKKFGSLVKTKKVGSYKNAKQSKAKK